MLDLKTARAKAGAGNVNPVTAYKSEMNGVKGTSDGGGGSFGGAADQAIKAKEMEKFKANQAAEVPLAKAPENTDAQSAPGHDEKDFADLETRDKLDALKSVGSARKAAGIVPGGRPNALAPWYEGNVNGDYSLDGRGRAFRHFAKPQMGEDGQPTGKQLVSLFRLIDDDRGPREEALYSDQVSDFLPNDDNFKEFTAGQVGYKGFGGLHGADRPMVDRHIRLDSVSGGVDEPPFIQKEPIKYRRFHGSMPLANRDEGIQEMAKAVQIGRPGMDASVNTLAPSVGEITKRVVPSGEPLPAISSEDRIKFKVRRRKSGLKDDQLGAMVQKELSE